MYAEIHCHSTFSLLHGASDPERLVERAVELGLPALALTDHDDLGGGVRFATAAKAAGLAGIIGVEPTVEGADGPVEETDSPFGDAAAGPRSGPRASPKGLSISSIGEHIAGRNAGPCHEAIPARER